MARARRGRGEGAVYQRADGAWCGSVSLGHNDGGRRKRRVVYGTTKKEVAEKLRSLQTAADAGRLVETERLTAGEYLRRWLANTAKPSVHHGTWDRYRQVTDLYLVPILGGVPLAKLAPLHVEQCYADMAAGADDREPASAWTRKMAGVVLSMALKHAVRIKLIPYNPAADVAKARPVAREVAFLTGPQSRLLLEVARPHRLYALFAAALGTGMRQGELLALQWADVDLAAGTIDVKRSLSWVKGKPVYKEPKSKAGRRSIRLPAFARDATLAHREAMRAKGLLSAPVFCTRTGTPISKNNIVRQVFRPLLRKANALAETRAAAGGPDADPIPVEAVRFHDLRHTHASALIAAGHSVKAVSRRLGHADITITLKVYSHLMPNDDEKLAAGADDLFG